MKNELATIDASQTPRTDAVTYMLGSPRATQHRTPESCVVDAHIARQLERELAAVQARLDALMLEYCPEDMTDEQKANWAANQWAVPADE